MDDNADKKRLRSRATEWLSKAIKGSLIKILHSSTGTVGFNRTWCRSVSAHSVLSPLEIISVDQALL